MKPDLSVIMIGSGRADDLSDRLDGLANGLTGRNIELWLVDNDPPEGHNPDRPEEPEDGPAEAVRTAYPRARWIGNRGGRSPWVGVNRALRRAGADRALIIPATCRPDPAAWAAMIDRLDQDDRLGLVFCRPTGPAAEPWGEPFLFRTLLDRLTDESGAPPASAAPDRCILVRLAAAENIGLVDERLAALEKIDWARRMKRSGWRVDQVDRPGPADPPPRPAPADYVDQYRSGLFYLGKWSPSSHLFHRIGLGSALTLDLLLALAGSALTLGASPVRRSRLAAVAALAGRRLGRSESNR